MYNKGNSTANFMNKIYIALHPKGNNATTPRQTQT